MVINNPIAGMLKSKEPEPFSFSDAKVNEIFSRHFTLVRADLEESARLGLKSLELERAEKN